MGGRRRAPVARPGSVATSSAPASRAVSRDRHHRARPPLRRRRATGSTTPCGARRPPRTSTPTARRSSPRATTGLPVLVGVEMDWLPQPHRARSPPSWTGAPSTSCWGRCTGSTRSGVDDPDFPASDALPPEDGCGREYLDAAGRGRAARASSTCSPTRTCPRCSDAACPHALDGRLEEAVAAIADDRRRHRVLVGRAAQAGRRALPEPRACWRACGRPGSPPRWPATRTRPRTSPATIRRRSPRCAGPATRPSPASRRREPTQVSLRWA